MIFLPAAYFLSKKDKQKWCLSFHLHPTMGGPIISRREMIGPRVKMNKKRSYWFQYDFFTRCLFFS